MTIARITVIATKPVIDQLWDNPPSTLVLRHRPVRPSATVAIFDTENAQFNRGQFQSNLRKLDPTAEVVAEPVETPLEDEWKMRE